MRTIIAIVVILLADLAGAHGQISTAAPRASDQSVMVRAVVAEFGRRLRMVAVLAGKDLAARAMEEQYAALVSKDLLAAWQENPERAPGKRTSSPSPERIDISAIKAKGDNAYEVKGKVILLTAQERREGGVFQANPVTMTVLLQDGRWVIAAYCEIEADPARDEVRRP